MPNQNKIKIFKDPVHGYIDIPCLFCQSFIDTPIFQRLRFIEQTGMRVLFPSAHHDRFSHSLGVYHLGKSAFQYFSENIRQDNCLGETQLKKFLQLKDTFLVACLMHDCGHAPFSHTFESEYNKKSAGEEQGGACATILKISSDAKLAEDLKYCEAPSPHEFCSAILLYEDYEKGAKELGIDINLAVRMILGCQYHSDTTMLTKLKNALISLLNSATIDVDKIDYILRDSWASGISNRDIDTHRLLSALTISKKGGIKHRLAFKKSALSVIGAVIEGRNHLYRWVYNHHKVVYCQSVIENAVKKKLAQVLCPDNPDEFLNKFFSLDAFRNHVDIGREKFLLPTDGDLNYLLKKYIKKIKQAEEYLYHAHRISLWKSAEEFDVLFPGMTNCQISSMFDKGKKQLFKDLKINSIKEDDIMIVRPSARLISIEPNDLLVEIEGHCESYDKIYDKSASSSGQITKNLELNFFYIYVDSRLSNYRDEIIKKLRSYA